MTSYQYTPLPSDRHVRLLRILPDPSGNVERPQLDLLQFPIAQCPAYRTMSYVWGSPERVDCLTIQNMQLSITRTLASALPSIFKRCLEGYLWCDQLCINQDDTDERNAQVACMGEIYQNAVGVLIWLALDDAVSVKLQLWLKIFGVQHQGFEWSHKWQTYSAPWVLENQERGEQIKKLVQAWNADPTDHALQSLDGVQPKDVPHVLHALKQFLNNDWFSRVWIVQEALLSRSAAVLLREESCSLESVAILEKFFVMSQDQASYSFDTEDTCGARVLSFMLEWHAPENVFDRTFYGLLSNLRRLMIRGRLQASDGRDMVYGLLGLDNLEEPYEITPDYSLSLELMFTITARKIVESRGDLDILFLCDGADLDTSGTDSGWNSRVEAVSLPTWVPDWRRELERCTERPDQSHPTIYHAKAMTDVRELGVQGKLIDRIEATSPKLYGALVSWFDAVVILQDKSGLARDNHVDIDACTARFHRVQRLLSELCTGKNLLDDMYLLRACFSCCLWRLHNFFDDGDIAGRNDMNAILDVFNRVAAPYRQEQPSMVQQAVESEVYNFSWSDLGAISGPTMCEHDSDIVCTISSCQKRRMQLLKKGMMALRSVGSWTVAVTTSGKAIVSKANIQPGDSIAVLRGFCSPVVLRKTDTGAYQYVSICRHEDAVDGVKLRDWPEEENEDMVLV